MPERILALTPAEHLEEAYAAFDLGFATAADVPTSASLSSAESIVAAVLSRADLPASLSAKALTLKFQILSRKADAAGVSSALAGLPSTLPGLTAAQSAQIKLLWRAQYSAAQGDWYQARALLSQIPANSPLAQEAKSLLASLRAGAEFRSTATRASGYLAVAHAAADTGAAGANPALLDPNFARGDLQSAGNWQGMKQALAILESQAEANIVARRRWLELAAPSIDPRMNPYPAGPAGEHAAAVARFRSRAGEWAPDPTVRASSVGGFRELLAHDRKVEDLRRAHHYREIITYVQNLPAQCAGVPGPLWSAYKIGWRTLGLGGSLALSEVARQAQAIRNAAALLPMPKNADVLGVLGAALVRQGSAEGPVVLARYFAAGPTDARMIGVMRRMMTTEPMLKMTPEKLAESLTILAGAPNEPQALAMWAMLAIHHAEKFSDEARPTALQAAAADGNRALELLASRQDPARPALKGELAPLLAEASAKLAAVPGGASPQNAGKVADKAAGSHGTEATAPSLTETGAPPAVASFEDAVALVGSDYLADPSPAISGLTGTELWAAAATVPDSYQSRRELRVARLLLNEAVSRGQSPLSAPDAEWKLATERRAEILLGDDANSTTGLALLATLAADADSSSTAVQRARLAADGVGSMTSLDAYNWAIEWMRTIDENHLQDDMRRLEALLGPPLKAAYARSDIQQFLYSPDQGSETRNLHRYLINRALVNADDFAGAGAVLDDTILSEELPADSEVLFTAEHWRLYAWTQLAAQTTDSSAQATLYQQVIDFVRGRLATLPSAARQNQLAYRARWAAQALGDSGAIEEFNSVIAETQSGS